MKNKILSSILIFALAVLTCLVFAIGYYLVPMSHSMVASNPELAHMRVPVLIMAWVVLAIGLAMILVVVSLFSRIMKNQVFEQKSVRHLKTLGILTLLPIPVLIALIAYTMANVAGSITNLWVGAGIIACGMLSIFFFLIASLFQSAVDYKTDTELTV